MLSPKLLLELRGGYNRFDEDFFPEDHGFDPNSIGLNTVSDPQDFGLPQIAVGRLRDVGANNYLPRGRVDTNWQGFANVSYNAGRHRMKLGYEFRRTHRRSVLRRRLPGRARISTASTTSWPGALAGGRQARGDSHR